MLKNGTEYRMPVAEISAENVGEKMQEE